MEKLTSLSELWDQYFVRVPTHNNVDTWTIVFIARNQSGLFVSLANPFSEEYREIFVDAVSEQDLTLFISHYKKHLMRGVISRFGLFRPDVNRVLTEYPDWQTFSADWFANPQLLQGNMPLLFDFPSSDEYRAMQLKDSDYAGYRRLLVVIYQYRKQQFQKVFIKGVDDAMLVEIQKQIIDAFSSTMPSLLYKNP